MNNMLEHSRLQAVGKLGQQIWLDQLSRELLTSGRLQRLILQDGVQGLSANPAIFYQAIQHDPAYQAALPLLRTVHAAPEARLEALVIPDLQRACDLFAPLYRDSDGKAGMVSFQVSPRLAHDAAGSVAEAKRLWALIARPNAMLQLPATAAGVSALEQLIYAGINVDMTLIFAPSQIQAVRAAHRRGLARRLQDKLSVQRIASVASVFISRIDVAVDALLPAADPLRGRAALAAARIAYADWRQEHGFGVFAAFGATPQRLLWASTATKSAAERDVRYLEGLIGADTIITVPDATLAAFRAHGVAETSLSTEVAAERAVLAQLAHQGIDLETIGSQLLADGLLQFEQAFSKLLALTA